MRFKEKYTLSERKEKYKKQTEQDKQKILIIAQKHAKSKLPDISPKFLCEKHYKFAMIKNMLVSKIKQKMGVSKNSATDSYFVFVGNNVPNGEQTMQQIYEKHKDEDGFLYLQYQDMEAYGNQNQAI